jgi:hypothetical protein
LAAEFWRRIESEQCSWGDGTGGLRSAKPEPEMRTSVEVDIRDYKSAFDEGSRSKLSIAINKLAQKGAIPEQTKDRLQSILRTEGTWVTAQRMRDELENYEDETAYEPDSMRYPGLKKTPFRPSILQILGEDCVETKALEYLVDGFRKGFEIGFEGSRRQRKAKNPMMTEEGRAAVQRTLDEDLQAGRVVKLTKQQAAELGVWESPVYAIAKKELGRALPGQWRRVFNLSKRFRKKWYGKTVVLGSVNEGIDSDKFPVRYSTVENLAELILSCEGKDVYMSKCDVKNAYRIIPLRESDYSLMGFNWNDETYMECFLPFGLSSACAIYERLAAAIEKIGKEVFGLKLTVHYLDDTIVCDLNQAGCDEAAACFRAILEMLGMAVNYKKVTEAAMICIYLGIEVDAIKKEVRIPDEKMARVKELLREWEAKEKCTLKEMQSLVGVLQHLCRAIKPGRLFVRRFIDRMYAGKEGNERATEVDDWDDTETILEHDDANESRMIELDRGCKEDLKWWIDFSETVNGNSFPFILGTSVECRFKLATDASDWGYAAVFGDQWFAFPWQQGEKDRFDIAYRELIAVLVAVRTWGKHFEKQQVRFYVDNANVVIGVKKNTTKNETIMYLLRLLHAECIRFKFDLWIEWVPTAFNVLADALSRGDTPMFRQLHKSANSEPTLSKAPVFKHFNDG